MKRFYLAVVLALLPATLLAENIDLRVIQEGDIIFQETRSPQARALKLATGSRYTHVGIIFKYPDGYKVLEAIQPVRITGINKFIRRGVKRHYVIKRLKKSDSLLSPAIIKRMKNHGKNFIGRDYDIYFGWQDDRLYCSELVWKLYRRGAGVKISQLQKLKDFDLTHPFVKKILKQRYGKTIPYNEDVISVNRMFTSVKLETIVHHN